MHISFGSDGYRGVIGAGFTLAAGQRIAAGAAGWLTDLAQSDPVAVGYDTRFLSAEMAGAIQQQLAGAGIASWAAQRPCPSPYLAFAVKQSGAPLGIQVTASHNPHFYNGIKLKGPYGGSLLTAAVNDIEARANAAPETAGPASWPAVTALEPAGLAAAYRDAVLAAAEWGGTTAPALCVDYMHGCTSGPYREVLAEVLRPDCELRTSPDPLFGGGKPEPLAPNLAGLIAAVKRRGLPGIAFDGDGDRLGVIDETGRCLATHEIFCLLLEDAARNAPPGAVAVTTVSFSSLVERVANAHALLVYEVPVGFRHVSEAMLQFEAVIGGEESGGAGFGRYLPERDALLMALRLLRYQAEQGAALSEMVDGLYARYGRLSFVREDFALSSRVTAQEVKDRVRGLADLKALAGDEVTGLNHRDGMKLKTAAGWVLVRPSGTEPLLRSYAEAGSEAQARAYLAEALQKVGLAELRA